VPTPDVSNRQKAIVFESGLHDQAVAGQLARRRIAGGRLDIQVVAADIGDPAAVGREAGVHQAGRRRVTADPAQRPGGQIEQPIVAERAGAAEARAIGEDQQPLAVRRPGIILDRDRLARRRHDEVACRDHDRAAVARDIVADEVGPALDILRRFDRVIAAAVGGPFAALDMIHRDRAVAEDALQRQRRRRGGRWGRWLGDGLGGRPGDGGRRAQGGESGEDQGAAHRLSKFPFWLVPACCFQLVIL
jgi:hypothetical protein